MNNLIDSPPSRILRLVCLLGLVAITNMSAWGAGNNKSDLWVCHVPAKNPDKFKAVQLRRHSDLDFHLEHGDQIFGFDLDPDCSGGFSVRVDPEIVLTVPELPGLAGGVARPVGQVRLPGGVPDGLAPTEFALAEASIKPGSRAELADFLARYEGVVILGDSITILNEDGDPEERTNGGWYLVSINPQRSSLGDLPALLVEAGIRGPVSFSSESAARTFAMVLREETLLAGPSFVLQFQANASPEHPLKDDSADRYSSYYYLDWSEEPKFSDYDTSHYSSYQGLSTSVVRAWEYMRNAGFLYIFEGLPGAWERARVAITDTDFDLDPVTGTGNDDWQPARPLQFDFYENDYRVGVTESPGDGWHGSKTASVCCAKPGNLFGAAGTGGRFVESMLFRSRDGSVWSRNMRTAAEMGADVLNMSWVVPLLFPPRHIVTDLREAVDFAASRGVVPTAAATNGLDFNLDKVILEDFETVDPYVIPCELDNVICVGSVFWDASLEEAENWHAWGSNVDIHAPSGIRTTVLPNPNSREDPNDWGDDELSGFGGTSAASPFIAGVIGLLRAGDPSLTLAEIQQILIDTANSSPDPKVANGYVDALRAVQSRFANYPPVATFIEPEEDQQVRWSKIFLEAEVAETVQGVAIPNSILPFVGNVSIASDIEGEICSKEVRSGIDPAEPTNCDPSPERWTRTLGTHVLTVTATDQFGAVQTQPDTVTVEVINDEPNAVLVSPLDGTTGYTDQDISFRGIIYDLDNEFSFSSSACASGERPCISWTSSLDGDITGATNKMNFSTPLSEGEHLITFYVEDTFGASDEESITLTILPGAGFPTADILTLPQDVGRDETITLVGTGSDPTDSVLDLSFEWYSDRDGFLGNGESEYPLFPPNTVYNRQEVVLSDSGCESIRDHVITLKVIDTDGNEGTDQIVIRVINIC